MTTTCENLNFTDVFAGTSDQISELTKTRRTLHRYGAWELLPRPPTEAERLEAFQKVPLDDLKEERKHLREHLRRFDMDTRSPVLLNAKFNKIRQQWFNFKPIS